MQNTSVFHKRTKSLIGEELSSKEKSLKASMIKTDSRDYLEEVKEERK